MRVTEGHWRKIKKESSQLGVSESLELSKTSLTQAGISVLRLDESLLSEILK